MSQKLNKIKEDFKSWSGFDLEGNNIEELQTRIKYIQWTLECEVHQQANCLISNVAKLKKSDF